MMIFLLGSACTRLASTVMAFDTVFYTVASIIALWALENFFIFGVMLCLIFASINPTIKEAINPPRPTPNQPAALAPGNPQMVQPVFDPRFSQAMPGQPGMQPMYAYQVPQGAPQQQYYQQQPVYAQQPMPQQAQQPMPQQFQHQAVSPQPQQYAQPPAQAPIFQSRDINESLAAEHATQNKEQPSSVSPVAEKPVELPEPTQQTELP
jgi:hypothetical protein